MSDLLVDFRNSRFLETSKVSCHPNRLNWRCELLLARNQKFIQGKRVLDLASHDGRFSYACLKLGASHVTGIEGRPQLVENAKNNLIMEGFDSVNFTFICGDIFDHLSQFELGKFDTILCFGLFYHTVRQLELLSQVKRIKPQVFILDTGVCKVPVVFNLLRQLKGTTLFKELIGAKRIELIDNLLGGKYFIYKDEDSGVENEASTIDPLNIVAYPTDEIVHMLLKKYGFRFHKINWNNAGIEDWNNLNIYKIGERVSYIAHID